MTLGQALKEGRRRTQLSLREVEAKTGISNGYLSLLESGTAKSPSPNYLKELSVVYGVAYSLLMELAGYSSPSPSPETPLWAQFERIDELTDDERMQVSNFVRFLRSSRNRSDGGTE